MSPKGEEVKETSTGWGQTRNKISRNTIQWSNVVMVRSEDSCVSDMNDGSYGLRGKASG